MKTLPAVGTKVVFNTTPSATLFVVIKHDDHPCRVWVREAGKSHMAEQLVDKSICLIPTANQLEAV